MLELVFLGLLRKEQSIGVDYQPPDNPYPTLSSNSIELDPQGNKPRLAHDAGKLLVCWSSAAVYCHGQELQERTVNMPIAILVGKLDHLVELGICQVLTQRAQDIPQLLGRDGAAAILVKHLEGIEEFLFCVGLLDALGHEVEEF